MNVVTYVKAMVITKIIVRVMIVLVQYQIGLMQTLSLTNLTKTGQLMLLKSEGLHVSPCKSILRVNL